MKAAPIAEEVRGQSGVVPIGSVLVVDDDDDMRALMVGALTRGLVPCTEETSGESALKRVMANPNAIDAIVLDVVLPGIDGIEVLRRLKRTPETAHIPVIVMTGTATLDRQVVHGVELGASDYLAKPCVPSVLLAKVRSLRTRAQADRKLRHDLRHALLDATSDPLTGLLNRRNFDTRLMESSAFAIRHHQPFAVILLDLDLFKSVNDSHGHAEGDRVLVHVADAIRTVLRAEDVAFRYGGEEFLLLLRACDAIRAVDVAKRLREQLCTAPFRFADGSGAPITFSAGVAAAEHREGFASGGLLRRADAALYRAKEAGRDRAERG